MAGWTNKDIADTTGIDEGDLSKLTKTFLENGNYAKSQLSDSEHATNFDIPIYNVWKQQAKSEGSSHFGNSEVRWVDNLLYLYTKPFDVVIDPFAGGGSTLDVCKKRLRRYFVDKDAKEQRKQKIFDLWLAGWTSEEIAEATGITKQAANIVCQETADLPNLNKLQQAAADHATDFDVPIYNVWKQQTQRWFAGELKGLCA